MHIADVLVRGCPISLLSKFKISSIRSKRIVFSLSLLNKVRRRNL